MGFLKILTTVAKNKLAKSEKVVAIPKTLTPLDMHQGSFVELPMLDLALMEVDGSLVKATPGQKLISAVGTYSLFGLKMYNCYLDDGHTFVRLATKADGKEVIEAKLWTSYSEVTPTTKEDWEFWLGSWKHEEDGSISRDEKGNAIKNEYGLIGWGQFQVDTKPPNLYNRSWSRDVEGGIEPVTYVETILDSAGKTTKVKHEAMEYNRALTENKDSEFESLLSTVAQDDESASVNIFVGVNLDHKNLKILRS